MTTKTYLENGPHSPSYLRVNRSSVPWWPWEMEEVVWKPTVLPSCCQWAVILRNFT